MRVPIRDDEEQTFLRAARKALAGGEDDRALEALVDAWRAQRAPDVAKLVLSLSTKVEPHLPTLGGKLAQFHPAWLAVARNKRAVDLPRLLDSVLLTTNRFGTAVVKALIERGELLAQWPADPRTAGRVVAHLRVGGYESTSRSTLPFWSHLLTMLRTQGDAPVIELLRPVRFARVFRDFSDGKRRIEWFQREADSLLAELDSAAATKTTSKLKNTKRRVALVDAVASKIAETTGSGLRPETRPQPQKTKPARRSKPRRPGEVSKNLRRAERASNDSERLLALLAAWRQLPDERIANLIDEISPRLEARLPRISGETRAAIHQAWIAIAKREDPSDLFRLLTSLTETRGRSTDALQRLETLRAWPRDPRTSRLITWQFEVLPFHSSSTFPFWSALIELAVEHADKRAVDAFADVASRQAAILESEYADRNRATTWFRGRLQGAAERLEKLPSVALEASDCRTLDLLARRIATDVGRRLLGHVYDNPKDQQAREVYADHLLETADPRGEFIALQLGGASEERAHEIKDAHAYTWVGPLLPFLNMEESRFESGFLDHGAFLGLSPARLARVVGHPVWATVKTIDLGWSDARRFKVTAAMRSLERVSVQTDEGPRAIRRVR